MEYNENKILFSLASWRRKESGDNKKVPCERDTEVYKHGKEIEHFFILSVFVSFAFNTTNLIISVFSIIL